MKSLERAVIGRVVFALIAVGIVTGAAAYAAARFEANEFMDDFLHQFAVGTDPTANAVFYDPRNDREPEDHFERVVWKSGSKIGATRGAPNVSEMPPGPGFHDIVAGGEAWRAYVAPRGDTTVMVMQRMSAREELALHAAFEVSLVILAAAMVVLIIIGWTVGRSMRRLNQLSTQIAARSVNARDPIPMGTLPSEFRPLIEAMNTLIARLQAALRQQQQFIADSAHELRTPLTALRIQIDNLHSVGAGDASAETNALTDGIARASRVLNQLLRLACFEGQRASEASEIVLVGEVLTQCVADAVDIAEKSGIDVGITKIDDAHARISRHDLQILFSNIIDNALRYTPRGGAVDCELLRVEGAAVARIIDSGPGVAPDLLPRLTERFFRAAALDIQGSGLGLSIVDAIAASYGLKLTIENRTDRTGLIVKVTFPTAAPAGSPDGNPTSG